MRGEVDISVIGAVVADRGRAAMVTELLGGQPLAAGELARRAGLSPSGASNHLKRLLAAGLVATECNGRNRIYRLASADVAHALESLGRLAPARPIRGLRDAHRHQAIALARTCYDHLAGRLGVELTRALLKHRYVRQVESGFITTRRGEGWLADELNIDAAEVRRSRRAFALGCLDLTERQPHLAGALGAAIANAVLLHRYARRSHDSRALQLTAAGEAWLLANGVTL